MYERDSAEIRKLAHFIWAQGKPFVIGVLVFLLRWYLGVRQEGGGAHEGCGEGSPEHQKSYEALLHEIAFLKEQLARYQKEPHPSQPPSTLRPDQREGMRKGKKKPSASSQTRKRAGRPKGHVGNRRPLPEHVDEERHHTLQRCPHCQNPLGKPIGTRTHYVEDIPEVKVRVIRHVIHRYDCSRCRRRVEPHVPGVLPRTQIGMNLAVQTLWLHYGLHLPIRKVAAILENLWHVKITPGGLYHLWARIGTWVAAEYDRLIEQAQQSAFLHVDETGWRLNGDAWWLWCFTNPTLVLYVIAPCRGSPVLKKVLGNVFRGILISDFFSVYQRFHGTRQKCLVHLQRACKVAEYHGARSTPWLQFASALGRWIRLVFHLHRRRHSMPHSIFHARVLFLHRTLDKIIAFPTPDPDVRRLQKRLRTYRNDLLTCLSYPFVPPDNTHAERALRPAVISRKTSFGNRSSQGAFLQALFMSLFQTWHIRHLDPLEQMRHLICRYLPSS